MSKNIYENYIKNKKNIDECIEKSVEISAKQMGEDAYKIYSILYKNPIKLDKEFNAVIDKKF